jgi:hypothetical protein
MKMGYICEKITKRMEYDDSQSNAISNISKANPYFAEKQDVVEAYI